MFAGKLDSSAALPVAGGVLMRAFGGMTHDAPCVLEYDGL